MWKIKTFVLIKCLKNYHIDWRNLLPRGSTPRGLFFVTNKTIQNSWVKAIRLMRNSLFVPEIMNSHKTVRNLAAKWTNKMVRIKLGLKLTRTNPWVCFRGPAKSFSKLNNSPLPRGKRNVKTVAFPLGSRGFPRGVPGVVQRQCKW